MSHITLAVPGMNKPPGRYDVTVRVAKDDGHPPDPAAFATAASQAASRVNASVLSAHTSVRGCVSSDAEKLLRYFPDGSDLGGSCYGWCW